MAEHSIDERNQLTTQELLFASANLPAYVFSWLAAAFFTKILFYSISINLIENRKSSACRPAFVEGDYL